jgi:hypothetical protein
MQDLLTGVERGKRIIVGGLSAHVNSLPASFLKTGVVIGVNKWPDFFPCDYWICLDTGKCHKENDDYWRGFYERTLKNLKAPKFARAPRDTEKPVPPGRFDYYFQNSCVENIPTTWEGRLRYGSTTATAAVNLAIILGAKEVFLYGVDFIGTRRLDGSVNNDWSDHVSSTNAILKKFEKLVPIYKLHPDSPLDVPYWPEIESFANG